MAAQIPLNDLGGAAYGVLGPAVAGGPNTAALANQLIQPGAVTPYAAAAGPPAALPDLAALHLRAPEAARLVNAPGGGDQWTTAFNTAQQLGEYMNNANYIAGKSNEFRTQMVGRLRDIYQRILSIRGRVGPMQAQANAAAAAQTALVDLINTVNQAGQLDPQQGQAMADLAQELQGINIAQMLNGLVAEINALATDVGIVVANDRGPGDVGPVPLAGGRKKKKKGKKTRKKQKGGYKFTRAAISRRSLRMSRRKSHSRKHKKHKKRKRTKRRRHRRRR